MEHQDPFGACHPVTGLLYFILVLGLGVFVMHPVSLLISLGSAVAYCVCLNGRKALRLLAVLLPMAVFAVLVNAAFNHRGMTILTYLPSGNPLTLESIAYGIAAAMMLAGVVTWLSCCTKVLTTDKFVYLFGRALPALALVLSMTLRFLPRFNRQLQAVRQARQSLGRPDARRGMLQKIRDGVTALSVTVTWSLENAIDTADSMKSRGYGLPGRSAFSIYLFDARDKAVLAWLCACGLFLICGWAAGGMNWHWFPAIGGGAVTPLSVCLQLAYLALCMTPLILNAKEELAWKRSRSEI